LRSSVTWHFAFSLGRCGEFFFFLFPKRHLKNNKGPQKCAYFYVWNRAVVQDKAWRNVFACVTPCNVMCKVSFPGSVKWHKVTSYFTFQWNAPSESIQELLYTTAFPMQTFYCLLRLQNLVKMAYFDYFVITLAVWSINLGCRVDTQERNQKDTQIQWMFWSCSAATRNESNS